MDSLKKNLSDAAILDVFILTYDRMYRYQGAWHLEKKLIFPSNVLLESENENALRDELMRRQGGAGQRQEIRKIASEDEKLLRFLCGTMKHIRMSKGVIRRGITQVTEGPLKGMESQICKIDRHKRLASLRTLEGRNIKYIPAGLEIVEKTI